MSRLAIQISVATVFLTNVVLATKPELNPPCSWMNKCVKDKSCVQMKNTQGKYKHICYDQIAARYDSRPVQVPKELLGGGPDYKTYLIEKAHAQAYLDWCYEKKEPTQCDTCCKDSYAPPAGWSFDVAIHRLSNSQKLSSCLEKCVDGVIHNDFCLCKLKLS